jgi:predicted RNase H-like HicB family nuclease
MAEFDASRYRISIQKVDDEGNTYFAATVAELPDVSVFAESHGDAYDQVTDVIFRLHAMAGDHGKPFPAPADTAREFSGRITLRVPKRLHAQLDCFARDDDVSLNTWIVAALSEKAGQARAIPDVEISDAPLVFTVGGKDVVRIPLLPKVGRAGVDAPAPMFEVFTTTRLQ